ncbi:MAG: VWA domain-containing protein [Planctomycetaceae bacterium]|nr:VWA domain-containing protein [Planctomycetaceae bacterium]
MIRKRPSCTAGRRLRAQRDTHAVALFSHQSRRGAAHVLIAAMVMVFLVTAALTVDVAYMQLVRSELRSATDAAAKAGAEALVRTQSEDAAISAAVNYAKQNTVGGRPLDIRRTDVVLGRVSGGSTGTYTFIPNATPANAVRVDARLGAGQATGAVPLFFGSALGFADFSTSQNSTAARQEVEVCLCLDRSGSMLFDMSGVDYSYPTPNPNLSSFSSWGTIWQYHLSPPHPTQSRWAVLEDAVSLFLREASAYPIHPRTTLVTWGSDYTMPISPNTFYPASTSDVPLPSSSGFSWSTNKTQIENAVANRTANPMMGGTNMSAGIDRGVSELTGANSLRLSNKVLILLTDGQWNAGRDPLDAARDAAARGITIHTVSMLSTDTATLQQIATIGGGNFYRTSNQAQLRDAFSELARSLPVVLTE